MTILNIWNPTTKNVILAKKKLLDLGQSKKTCPYMIENLFTNPTLFTECKNNRVSRFCGRFRADRYARNRDFPFIKLEGKMPLFDLKCALNQPKMVQNT